MSSVTSYPSSKKRSASVVRSVSYGEPRPRLRGDTVRLVLGALEFVLDRQSPEYPFIDTKFNIADGNSFADSDPLRGKGVVYSWIQGRGLEAMAEHAAWLRADGDVGKSVCLRAVWGIWNLLPRVIASMEAARERSGGYLPFMMDLEGRALTVSADGEVVAAPDQVGKARTFSDLFYCKGLVAAANCLKDRRLVEVAEAIFAETTNDIRSGRFVFGQVALDPKNPVQAVPGRHSHAGWMIAVGAATQFYNCTGDEKYAKLGVEFIEHVLENYTLTGGSKAACVSARYPFLKEGDLWEFIGEDGLPWTTPEGRLWSDSGHATEFAGLAFAHLRDCGIVDPELSARLRRVLLQNFQNGFAGFGIVKSYDLQQRLAINTDKPWWSLPETMRAAALGALTAQGRERKLLEECYYSCWNGFTEWYVRPQVGFMAVQCLDGSGNISPAIPATPDADPCYHTGLSLIGCLPWLDERRGYGGMC